MSVKAVNSVIVARLAIRLTGFVGEESQKTFLYFHVHQPDRSLMAEILASVILLPQYPA